MLWGCIAESKVTGQKYRKNVGLGRDHTLFALKDGKVTMSQKRQAKFDNTIKMKKVIKNFLTVFIAKTKVHSLTLSKNIKLNIS